MNSKRSLAAALGAAALADRSFAKTAGGVLAPVESFAPCGVVDAFHNGEHFAIAPNIIPAEWRSQILRQSYKGAAQSSLFYIAPFTGEVNVELLDNLTAATFNSTLTEFVGYSETARPAWVSDAEAGQAIANAATLAKITVTAAGTIWGIGMLTVATKSSTAGYLAAASKFGSGRPVQIGDTLEFKYTMRANLPA